MTSCLHQAASPSRRHGSQLVVPLVHHAWVTPVTSQWSMLCWLLDDVSPCPGNNWDTMVWNQGSVNGVWSVQDCRLSLGPSTCQGAIDLVRC